MVQSLAEAKANYGLLYSDVRRMRNRMYWSDDQQAFFSENTKVPDSFIANVIQKIEAALTNGYADVVYYADLGHVHVFYPQNSLANSQNLQMALDSPHTKLLFHSAELFQFRDGDSLRGPFTQDPWMQWRYYSRNFVAANDTSSNLAVLFAPPPAVFNTVRELPGFTEVATVYFSANKNGCFSFQQNGQPFNMDMTFNP